MPLGGSRPLVFMQLCRARPICLRLFAQETRLAAARTFWTAGTSRPMRMAMIAITTNSSISVKPFPSAQRTLKVLVGMAGLPPVQMDADKDDSPITVGHGSAKQWRERQQM